MRRKNNRLVAAVILLLVIVIVCVCCAVKKAGEESNARSPEDIVQFLKSFGWETDINSMTEKDVIIPLKFSEVYEQYNDLQKKQGYDLAPYKTDTVKSYTFKITNHPAENVGSVMANVLVYNGKVIGGDICSYALNGFMTGFNNET